MSTDRANPHSTRWRAIIDQFLAGRLSLDSAATEFATAWREWRRALDVSRPTTVDELLTDRPNLDALYANSDFIAQLKKEEFARVGELIQLAGRKIRDSDEGAA